MQVDLLTGCAFTGKDAETDAEDAVLGPVRTCRKSGRLLRCWGRRGVPGDGDGEQLHGNTRWRRKRERERESRGAMFEKK